MSVFLASWFEDENPRDLARWAAAAGAHLVETFIASATTVAQARTSLPFTSTMQVSQLSIGPSCG